VGPGEGHRLARGDELKRYVVENGISENVTFTGAVGKVENYLRAADCFILVSQAEAFGISLAEAAACGLPAIGSDIGGIRDIVLDNRNGILVRYGDEYELKCAITRIGLTEEIREVFGREARRIAIEKFDIDKIVEDYTELLDASRCESKSRATSACV
jgi:glycosyltransferase involved in cell wall biosynthesis